MRFLPLLLCFCAPLALATPPVFAQLLPLPTDLITDEKVVLSPDFVRDCDAILVGRLARRAGEKEARPVMTGFEMIRGENRDVGRGLLLPTSQENTPLPKTLSLAFCRFDPAREQLLVLALLDASEANVARAKELAEKNRRVLVTVSTDKTSYLPEETIVAKLEAKNVSPKPLRLFVGPYAVQRSATFGGSTRSNGTGGSHTRQENHYVSLAPGESWISEQKFTGPFPVGEVSLSLLLDSSDNFLGSWTRDKTAKAAQKRLNDVALIKEGNYLSVKIEAPSADAQKAMLEKMASPNWNEVYRAALSLSQLDNAEELSQLRALSSHPWPALRILAARSLAKSGQFSPELRKLCFDPSPSVRSATFEAIYRNHVGGAGLSALAVLFVENEARQKELLPAKAFSQVSSAVWRNREANTDVGDLLAARIESNRANADGINAPYLLNLLAENQRNTRLTESKDATLEQAAQVLAAWKTARANSAPKPKTAAQFEAEIAAARAAMFNDFRLGPAFETLFKTLKPVDSSLRFPKPENEERQRLESLDGPARADLLRLLKWETRHPAKEFTNYASFPAFKAIVQTQGAAQTSAQNYLLGLLYATQHSDTAFYIESDTALAATLALGYGDPKIVAPHLRFALASSSHRLAYAAATALLQTGDKAALPELFEPKRWEEGGWLSWEETKNALRKATGQTWETREEWRKWWTENATR